MGQNQHPGPFLESTDQGLSFGTNIYGLSCLTEGDISSLWFDPSYTLPTVKSFSVAPKSPKLACHNNFF